MFVSVAMNLPAALLASLFLTLSFAASSELPLTSSAPVGAASSRQYSPSVAAGGGQYFAAWADDRGGVWGTRVSLDGELLDATGIQLTSPSTSTAHPFVIFHGSEYQIFSSDLRLSRVALAGTVLESSRRLEIQTQYFPVISQVSSNGRRTLLVWYEFAVHYTSPPKLTILDESGTVLSTMTEAVPGLIRSDGDSFLAIRAENGSLLATRLDAEGQLIEGEVTIAPASSLSSFDFAWNGGNWVLVTQEGSEITVRLLDEEGKAITQPASVAALQPGESAELHVAGAGGHSLVTWTRQLYDSATGLTTDVYARRVDGHGSPVGGEIPLMISPKTQSQIALDSSGNGAFFVAWYDEGDNPTPFNIVGREVTAPGEGSPLLLSRSAADQTHPVVAVNGSLVSVAFLESPNGANGSSAGISLSTILPGGTPAKESGRSVTQSGSGWAPAIATDGSNSWVAGREGNQVVRLAIADSAGTVSRALTITETEFGFDRPAIAFGGGVYLVVWQQSDIDPAIWAMRIDPNGTVLDSPFRLGSGYQPEVAFDGRVFVVAARNGYAEIWSQRVTPGFVLLDPAPLVVATNPTVGYSGVSLTCSEGRCLVAWESPRPPYSRNEIRAAAIANGALVAPLLAGDGGFQVSANANDQRQATVAWNRGNFVVAWTESLYGATGSFLSANIVARRFASDGSALGLPFAITSEPGRRSAPALATTPDGSLLAVYERLSPEPKYGRVPRIFYQTVTEPTRRRPVRR